MVKMKSVKGWGVTICAVTSLLVLFFYVISTLLFRGHSHSSGAGLWSSSSSSSSSSGFSGSFRDAPNFCHFPPKPLTSRVWKNKSKQELVLGLINDLKARTRVAAASVSEGGNYSSLSAEEEAEWESKNPCRSRAELGPLYSLRKHAKDLPVNPFWEEVFRAYSDYHRTCMKAVGDVADYFNERKTSTGCQFVVADTGASIGVGNKLQVVANSVLYGIITRRVILLPTSHLVTSYICEPIVGSSWILDSETFPTPPQNKREKWEMSEQVLAGIDQYRSDCEHEDEIPQPWIPPYAAGDITNQKQPYQRFYCPTEQSFYSEVTWVYLSGCIYTIPKIFAIPTFQPTLEALFPDKVVLTRIFRSMILPADSVWSRVRRVYDTYLQPADRRVGIQMRYLRGVTQYQEAHDLINDRVVDCVTGKAILPQLDESPANFGPVLMNNSTRITVFVTSLYLSLHDKLSKMYMQNPTIGGNRVALVQLTHEDRQEFGVEVDIQAFTEIILLSLSDDLVLAPISTFGGSAQTYGALTPWFIEYRPKDDKLPSCERGRSVEVCNQYTPKNFECKYDVDLGTKLFSDVVPFIEDCPQIEFPFLSETEQGVHLRTTFRS